MRIIGLDPGTYRTGYGIIDVKGSAYLPVSYGCLESKEVRISGRFLSIYDQLKEILSLHKPECSVVESPFLHRNPKVSMQLSEVRGVLILSLAQLGVEIAEYSPLEIKKAIVGYGRADKTQVGKMVKTLLNLPHIPRFNDTSDALAAALCHAQRQKSILAKYQ
ncbi:crossover junction endodeoxyribonuclease RuvC [bacterium]|nr:crossover junction endodeoxyribonuclease RuvC [bacterium]MCP5461845.1 crossover junction endodeoxyribonuclease RuvC [bacterium]